MKKWAIVIAMLVTSWMCQTFIPQWKNMGDSDWDQNLMYTHAAVHTIQEYKQFPHWNPYHCGGNALNAHSHARTFSPFTSLYFLFPSHEAIKLDIFLNYLWQFLGFFFLFGLLARVCFSENTSGKETPTEFWAKILFATVCTFNSNMTLRNHDGWITQISVSMFPWIAICLIQAIRKDVVKYGALAGLLYALQMLAGGINVFPDTGFVLFLTAITLGIFSGKETPWKKIFGAFAVMVFFAIGLSALKSLPLLSYMQDYPRHKATDSGLPLRYIWNVFFNQKQDIRFNAFPEQAFAYTEYSAYIGWSLILFFMASFWGIRKNGTKSKKIAGSIFISFFIIGWTAFGGIGSVPGPWDILHQLPVYKSFHIPSRFLIFVVFLFSAGTWIIFIGTLDRFSLKTKILLLSIGTLLTAEMLNTTRKPIEKAFLLPFAQIEKEFPFESGKPFDQFFTGYNYGFSHAPYYPFISQRLGRLNCFESTNPPLGAKPTRGENAQPLLIWETANQSKTTVATSWIKQWTPNEITLDLSQLSEKDLPGHLIYNHNFYRGWEASQGTLANLNNQIGIILLQKPGNPKLVLKYTPVIWKLALTVFFISLGLFFVCIRPKKQRTES